MASASVEVPVFINGIMPLLKLVRFSQYVISNYAFIDRWLQNRFYSSKGSFKLHLLLAKLESFIGFESSRRVCKLA